MRKINGKKGAGNGLLIVILALLVVGLLGLGYFAVNQTQFGNQGTKEQTSQTGQIVTTDPVVQITGQDAGATGTTVATVAASNLLSQGNDASYGAVTLGTTTMKIGQSAYLFLVNGTQYHNIKVDVGEVNLNTFPKTVKFNKNSTVTENLYTTTGLVLANGVGTQNQTDLGNGATYNFKDEMTGTSLANTQDLVCIVEITAGSNASTTPSDITYGGNAPISTSKPTWYTTAGTDSNVYVFAQPALVGSNTQTNTLHIASKSTGRFSGTSYVKKTCLTKEWFIDPNTGKATYDVADSNGNVKSIARYTYTAYFQ